MTPEKDPFKKTKVYCNIEECINNLFGVCQASNIVITFDYENEQGEISCDSFIGKYLN